MAEFQNAEEIGEALGGVSARSVLRQFERGRFPGYRVSPRRVVFRLEEVLEAVKEQHGRPIQAVPRSGGGG
jgi:hypothetical protein